MTPEDLKTIDSHIGQRVRERRIILGLSQTNVADHFGLTFQQIQKYERGMNRIAGSKLWALTSILGVPIPYFFEGLDGAGNHVTVPTHHSRNTARLTRAYLSISDPRVQGALLKLADQLGSR